jgi:hypothetical protein
MPPLQVDCATVLHRSASRHGGPIACALLLLVCASPSQAASVPVPADAPVVAGPTPGGVSAVAFAYRDRVCMAFLREGEPRPTTLADNGDCVDLPVLAPFEHTPVAQRTDDDRRYVQLGVVGAATARVQFKLGGAVVATTDTRPSPLPGATAGLRFYAIETEPSAASDELALLDTFDTVRRAYALGTAEDISLGGPPSPLIGRGTILAQGRRGGVLWALRSRIDHPLAATPLLPERRVPAPCIVFQTTKGGGDACDEDNRAAEPLLVEASEACAPIGPHVAVLARATVRRVVVVLGDGRRLAVRLRAVPGAPAGLRAGVVVLGTGLAVRRVTAFAAGERVLSSQQLGIAPVSHKRGCGFGLSSAIIRYHSGLPAKRLGSGPHTPQVATDGVRLCLAIDHPPHPPVGCALPPLDAHQVVLDAEPTSDGRYIAGFVPREVALVRLALDDGTARDITPAPIAGLYAGHVNLVAVDVPGPRRVIGYDLLNDAGMTLTTVDYGPEQRPLPPSTVLLRRPGHSLAPITAFQIPADHGVGPATCVGLKTIGYLPCGLVEPGYFVVVAGCATRQIVIAGLLRHANQRVAVRTASGREIRARVVRLPAALRRVGKGFVSPAAVAIAVVPAREAPRRLTVRGPAASHADLTLPAAGEQCGYRTYATPGELRG